MSKKSGSFFSLPTIIFLVVMYNVIFDDDDEKTTEVKTDTEQTEVINVDEVTVKAKEIIIKTKEGIEKTVEEYLSSDEGKDQDFIVTQEPPKEEKVEPELKPLDEDEDEDKPMKSL